MSTLLHLYDIVHDVCVVIELGKDVLLSVIHTCTCCWFPVKYDLYWDQLYPVTCSFSIAHSPTQIEYVTAPDGDLSAEGVETTVIIAGDSSDVITEGPLDIPGATVEIVETDPLPLASHQQRKSPKKEAPAYRQHLLFRCTVYPLLVLHLLCTCTSYTLYM